MFLRCVSELVIESREVCRSPCLSPPHVIVSVHVLGQRDPVGSPRCS